MFIKYDEVILDDGPLTQSYLCPYTKGNLDTDMHTWITPYEDGDRDQECQSKPPKALRKNDPTDTLI